MPSSAVSLSAIPLVSVFTIDDDGVPVCKLGLRMHKDGYEAAKHRAKYRCPKSNRKRGCFCEHPCSPAKYGRIVHIFTDDNPRLLNIPPRDSKAWEKEYDRRTSVERSNTLMPGKCPLSRHFKNHS